MKKIEKQSNSRAMSLLQQRVNVKTFRFKKKLYQAFKMVKNVPWTAIVFFFFNY